MYPTGTQSLTGSPLKPRTCNSTPHTTSAARPGSRSPRARCRGAASFHLQPWLPEQLAGFCAHGDIRPQGVCTSLEAKLRAAARARAAGDVDRAIRNLESALHEVEVLPDSRVEPHALDRLIAGIEAVLSLLI